MRKSNATAIAILTTILSPCLAQTPAPATRLLVAQKAMAVPDMDPHRNSKLGDAASIAEDLIDNVLSGKADKVAEKVAAMRKTMTTLRPLVGDSDFATIGRQVTDMEQASAKNDVVGTALAAVEVYRTVENATDAARGPVPLEVAMMDYAGFKLSLLTAVPSIDWANIATTAKEADTNWTVLGKKIPDTGLRNLVSTIQDGLTGAVERRDINGVKFASKMQLEVVDVLEEYFKRIDKSGKRSGH